MEKTVRYQKEYNIICYTNSMVIFLSLIFKPNKRIDVGPSLGGGGWVTCSYGISASCRSYWGS